MKKILLVDDEAIIALAESELLKHYGYSALIAYSSNDAVRMIAADPDIDLVLMDIDLGKGGIDGTVAAEEILKIRDLPILFLSSHTEREIVEKTEKISFYGYVVKNSGETILLASIKMAFKLFEANRNINHQKKKLEAAREDLLRSDLRLKFERELLLTIVNSIPDQIYMKDLEGRYVIANTAKLQALGIARAEDIVGKTAFDFFPHDVAVEYEAAEKAVMDSLSPEMNIEESLLDSEGRKSWRIRSTVPVMGEDGCVRGIVKISRDITGWKRAEENLRENGLSKQNRT